MAYFYHSVIHEVDHVHEVEDWQKERDLVQRKAAGMILQRQQELDGLSGANGSVWPEIDLGEDRK